MIWVTTIIAILLTLVAFLDVRKLLREKEAGFRRRGRSLLRWVPLRAVVGAGGIGLYLLIRKTTPSMDNVNTLSFGVLLSVLLVGWAFGPVLLILAGRSIKHFGAAGMSFGGLIVSRARRITNIAVIFSVLLGLSGLSAILTLASSSAGGYIAMNTLKADATVAQPVQSDANDIVVTPFNVDGGWVLAGQAAQAVIIGVDPGSIGVMVEDSAIVAGSLADITGSDVAAPEEDHSLGDTITIVSDEGETQVLTVVALTSPGSVFGNDYVVDDAAFHYSSDDAVAYRSYARAPGGLPEITSKIPGPEWVSIDDYLDADLDSVQSGQLVSIASMIGGVGIVALAALLYSSSAFRRDHLPVVRSLLRLGMSASRLKVGFALLGVATSAVALLIAAASLAAGAQVVAAMFAGLEITQSVQIPWALLAMVSLVGAVSLVGTMVLGRLGKGDRSRTRSGVRV